MLARAPTYDRDMQVLSPAHHSGGEKSVSTIMYLLSLQGITKTPFRVVDEINQGMDQTNERKVFQAMVEAANREGTAQCLLMTPKLLPQLSYGDCVNVLGIHNAAHMKEVAKKLKPSQQLDMILGVHNGD
jgi:structural maintenance of chromosomes protein 5